MRISDRFIDYGTTGVFFLIGQFILLALWGQTGWLLSLTHVPIASALYPTLNSLLAALGITAIFFFGLFLDLLGSVFPPLRLQELTSFKEHVDRNTDWFLVWCDDPKDPSLKTNYEEFQAHYANLDWGTYMHAYWGRMVKQALDFFPRRQGPQRPLQTNKADDLAEHSPPQQKFDLGKLDHSYMYLRYFMQSYILINSGLQQQDSLSDQVHLWRTGRAVCSATALWLIEATIALFIGLIATIVAIFGPFFLALLTLLLYILIWFVLFLLTLLTLGLARGAFTRMCVTLFSLAQITYVNKKGTRLPNTTTSCTEVGD